ncbi:MAG: response regulator [Deltaproteobacteria bacterium]|nr:response regulator [Deltaproteobacteria bacterium]
MGFQNKRRVMPSTILMAEDDPDDRFLIRRAFDALGISAALHFVGDGEELMNCLGGNSDGKDLEGCSSPPALLFLDLNMPKKDGREVLMAIRSDPSFRDLPIIIWTTSNHAADKVFCKKNGASSYVTKPHSYKELVKEIRKVVGQWLPQSD